jgi:hypothetical protein
MNRSGIKARIYGAKVTVCRGLNFEFSVSFFGDAEARKNCESDPIHSG